MYNVLPDGWHATVMAGAQTDLKLVFADKTLHGDAVTIDGVTYDECVVEDGDELTIGTVLMSELTMTLINDAGQIDFAISEAEFTAYIGAKINGAFSYVPLGVFTVQKPDRLLATNINVIGYDRMAKFNVLADSFLDGLTVPFTLRSLFTGLCEYVGVPASAAPFLNDAKVFSTVPVRTQDVTCREVLSWIAEAACSFARISRDGVCELVWFSDSGVTLGVHDYYDIDVAEYQVQPIDKLQVSATENDIGVIIPAEDPTATNGYQIVDNPCLYGTTDAEIRPYAQIIYDRLTAYPAFAPIAANVFCDWAIQAGDVITVVGIDGVTEYRMPVYGQSIRWVGGSVVTASYQNSGAERRPVMSAINRKKLADGRSYHEIVATIETFRSEIYDGQGHSKIEQLADEISLVVDSSGGEPAINAASIVASINEAGSTVKISADHIQIEGEFVTFDDLSGEGRTVINGGNLSTGAISVGSVFTADIDDGTVTIGGFTVQTSNLYAPRISISSSTASNEAILLRRSANETPYAYIGNAGDRYLDMEVTREFRVLQNGSVVMGVDSGGAALNRNYMYTEYSANALGLDSDGYFCYTGGSSERFKRDIQPINESLYGNLDDYEPVSFVFNDDTNNRVQFGFIAEKVRHLCPSAVKCDVINGRSIPARLDMQQFIPMLVRELQKSNARIRALEGVAHGTD